MFLLVDLQDFLFRFRVEWTKKSSENDLLTGHFQSFLISPEKTVKLCSKVNQQPVLNL